MSLRRYKVFFAIPFDVATMSMYKLVFEELKEKFSQDFEFSFGTTSVIEPSGEYTKIEEFRAQNQDFLTRFVTVIQSNDIVVADLTNNNPSVHIELGIALNLNKNILRVSGRDLIGVATDLQGYEVNKYASRQELFKRICSYLDYFLHIKRLPRRLTVPDWKEIGPTDHKILQQQQFAAWQIDENMRDGEVTVNFKFKATFDESDWFAILLRAEGTNPWQGGGYLVYVRLNGNVAIRKMGTIARLEPEGNYAPLGLETEHIFCVNIDGNHLFVALDQELELGLHIEGLEIQSPGSVVLGCHRSIVAFRNIEFVNHDTIAFR